VQLLSTFSLNMIHAMIEASSVETVNMAFTRVSLDDARCYAANGVQSFVGHQTTADIISAQLGIDVPMNRVSSQLGSGETALIAQYIGPRLPEGAKVLPTDARIEYFLVTARPA
jgi:hypothetical protein